MYSLQFQSNHPGSEKKIHSETLNKNSWKTNDNFCSRVFSYGEANIFMTDSILQIIIKKKWIALKMPIFGI